MRALGAAPRSGCRGHGVLPRPDRCRLDAARPGDDPAAVRAGRLEVAQHVVPLDHVTGDGAAAREVARGPRQRDARPRRASARRVAGRHRPRLRSAVADAARLPGRRRGGGEGERECRRNGDRGPSHGAVPRPVKTSRKTAPWHAGGAVRAIRTATTASRVSRGASRREPRKRPTRRYEPGHRRLASRTRAVIDRMRSGRPRRWGTSTPAPLCAPGYTPTTSPPITKPLRSGVFRGPGEPAATPPA